MKLKEIKCKNCGGELQFSTSEKLLTCVFCGTKYFLDDAKEVDFKNPDGIIQFKSTRDAAKDALTKWLKEYKFSPDDISNIAVEEISPLYIPLFLFKIKYSIDWTATSVFYEEETYETYELDEYGKRSPYPVTKLRRTEKFQPASGRVNLTFEYIEVDSQNLPGENNICRKVYNHYKNEITPFSEETVKQARFEPFSETPKDSPDKALKVFAKDIESRIGETIPGESFKGLNWSIDDTTIKENRYYIPIWIVRYSYKDEQFQAFIDGIEHELISGTRPKDPDKVKQAEAEEEQKRLEEEAQKQAIIDEYKGMRRFGPFSYIIIGIYLLAFLFFELIFYRNYLYYGLPLKSFLIFLGVGTIGYIIFFKITKAVRKRILRDSEEFLKKHTEIYPGKKRKSSFGLKLFKIIIYLILIYSLFLIIKVERARYPNFPKNIIEKIQKKLSSTP